jgi:hypothetical protein
MPEKLVRFLRAPLELRSYTNLIYLTLAFPLGLAYFLFLAVGLSLGFGLTIVLIGFPILALVFGGSWMLAALERELAILLLGAHVPARRLERRPEPRGVVHRTIDFLADPVTWKGIGYLIVKLPLGMVTFVVTVFLVSLSAALLLAPLAYPTGLLELDGSVVVIDSPGAAVACAAVGLVVAFFSIHILNGLAWVWRGLASAMLGRGTLPVQAPA